jgi:hypothetical protein
MTNSSNPSAGIAARVPTPPDPRSRQTPLPDFQPKPADEDPGAPERVAAILASPTYRAADDDSDFLARGAVRGVRLQLDYLKAEKLLEEKGIHHTVVIFGSTRSGWPNSSWNRRPLRAMPRPRAASPLPGASSPRAATTTWPAPSASWSHPRACSSAAIPWW